MRVSAKVLCYGEALWDITDRGRVPGGAPMNVALSLVQLGVDVSLLTRVGDDASGRELIAHIAERGLATDTIQVDSLRPTGSIIADTSNPHAASYDIVAPVAWDFIDSAEWEASARGAADTLVFGSLAVRHEVSRESLLRLLEHAKLKVLDVNLRAGSYTRETVDTLLAQSDWVKINEDELDVVAGWLGIQGPAPSLLSALQRRYELDVVCATLGANGALMLRDGQMLEQPAYDVAVVDTIGCGDAFLGAWLAGMLAGDAPSDALRAGCAAGAIAATSAGSSAGLSSAEIRQFIENSR